MKPRFTIFQKIMTVIFIALQIAVMISDGIRLATAGDGSTGNYYYAVNLALCAGLLAVFLVLIFNPKICVSTEETDSDRQLTALISASRSYMCFIAVDISLIFAFVMFLSKKVSHPALWIVIGGVAIFIIGAVKYIYDSQNFAVEEQTEAAGAVEEASEEKPSDEAAEEKEPAADPSDEEPVEEAEKEQAENTEEIGKAETEEAASEKADEEETTDEPAGEESFGQEPADTAEDEADAEIEDKEAEASEDKEETTEEDKKEVESKEAEPNQS